MALEVKNHLDHHVSVQNRTHQKKQEHRIKWVEKHMVQSLSDSRKRRQLPSALQI